MTIEIIRDKGSITINCNEGDDFISAYKQLVNENVITCSNCGSQVIKQTFWPISKRYEYHCHNCGKTWLRKEVV